MELNLIPAMKNISYMYARDPNIMSCCFSDIERNLYENYEMSTCQNNITENLQVFLRVKNLDFPQELYDIEGNILISKFAKESNALRHVGDDAVVKKKYTFSKIFKADANQDDIFNYIVKPRILNFMNGGTYSLLTYGASGSGKIYTILGNAEEPGLIPRSLEYIFKSIPNISGTPKFKPMSDGVVKVLNPIEMKQELHNADEIISGSSVFVDRNQHIKTYHQMQQQLNDAPAFLNVKEGVIVETWISFTEIYNEEVYDLLNNQSPKKNPRQKLHLGNLNGNAYIKELTSINVSSGIQAYQLLQYGLNSLNYASTSTNSHSSRSHCIFTIKLVQRSEKHQNSIVNYFNFCDLADSERVNKSLNIGDRLIESKNINSSLLVLHRCIKIIRGSQKNSDNEIIPFRKSKLTQLFQKALTGQENICMIANINPIKEMFDETQHVLNFSAIAQDIIVEQQAKPQSSGRNIRFSQYIQSRSTVYKPATVIIEENEEIETLKDQVAQLQLELIEQKASELDREMEIRREMVNDFDKLYNILTQNSEDQYKNMEKIYDNQVENLKNKIKVYRSHAKVQVINLNDNRDEETNDLKEQNTNLKKSLAAENRRNESIQSQLTKKSFELAIKENALNVLNNKLTDQIKVNQNLEFTLQEAVLHSIQTNNKINRQEAEINKNYAEIIKLHEEIAEMVAEISIYNTENNEELVEDIVNKEDHVTDKEEDSG